MSRQRIIENINLTSDSYFRRKEDLTESVIPLTEANGATSVYKALAVYTFPISRPDQRNLNNRIYTSDLWENVIASGKAEGAFGLMDHPSEEGSVKDIWCVWRNLRFSKDRKLILCDAYLFGNWGKQVLEALEAGGRVGLSSSGWGEFLDDNTTLDPNTYEIERPADFVLNPSYEVFGVQDDLVESINKEQDTIARIESTLENSPKDHIKENTMNTDVKKTSPSLEERNFELNMRSMFKEAKKIEDIQERINESKKLLGYFEGQESSIKTDIEEAIKADEATIYEGYKRSLQISEEKLASLSEEAARAKELQETVNSLNKTIASLNSKLKESETLNEEFENACTLLDSMKEYSEKQEELVKIAKAESNAKVSVSEYKEAIVYSEELEEENKKLKKTINSLRRQLRALIEASKKKEDDEDEEKDDDEVEDKKASDSKKPSSDDSDDSDDEDEEDDEDDTDEEEDEEDSDKEEKKESSYSVYKGLNPEVVDYYEDLEYRNPRVVKIKEEILSKHTLLEAQKTYLKLRSFVENRNTKLYTSGSKKYVESTEKNYRPLHEGWV